MNSLGLRLLPTFYLSLHLFWAAFILVAFREAIAATTLIDRGFSHSVRVIRSTQSLWLLYWIHIHRIGIPVNTVEPSTVDRILPR